MNKEEFWQLISSAKEASKDDQTLQEQVLIDRLVQCTPEQIVEFECILCNYVIEADDFTIMAAQKILYGYVSDETYLGFRCWLVGQGETVYKSTLQSPDTLASILEEPYQSFEELLQVATTAFKKRTDKDTPDDTFPQAVAVARGLDYDVDSVTKGEDWTENQLPKMLPKLWKKFGAA